MYEKDVYEALGEEKPKESREKAHVETITVTRKNYPANASKIVPIILLLGFVFAAAVVGLVFLFVNIGFTADTYNFSDDDTVPSFYSVTNKKPDSMSTHSDAMISEKTYTMIYDSESNCNSDTALYLIKIDESGFTATNTDSNGSDTVVTFEKPCNDDNHKLEVAVTFSKRSVVVKASKKPA